MKTRRQYLSRALLTASALTFMTASGAFASTPPCTPITNTATLKYKVGAVDQTDITSASNAANSFNVGVKVLLTVTNNDGGNKTVVPGNTPAVLQFTVQNNGNAVHDYVLAFSAATTGTPSPHGVGNDSFDITLARLAVFVESGATAGYQVAEDTATSIDNLAGDGASKIVYVVYTPTDLAAANGSVVVEFLSATTQWANGTLISQTATGFPVSPTAAQQSTCNGSTPIDVVFGDGAGLNQSPADAARDGVHSDGGAFIVSSANIGVTKGFTVVSDPVNGAVPGAKAIPGAVIRYSVAIANTGTAPALLSTISDALAATLQIIPAGATWNVPASTRTVKSGTVTADTVDSNGDGLGHTNTALVGGTVTATMTTILAADGGAGYAAGELKAGETVTVTFDATVQ